MAMAMMSEQEIVIAGAGASGLAVAAELVRRGRRPVLLQRDDTVGATWAARYDRLCLHTVKRWSALPGLPMPGSYPRYVPKDLYAQYLAGYAAAHKLDLRNGQAISEIQRVDGGWIARATDGEWRAGVLVVAMGQYNQPRLPRWPGSEQFGGRLLHSSAYRTGSEFAGLRVLVIGIGNTGCEIAADLVDGGATRVAITVRNVPPISAREIAGIPVQLLGMALMPLPARVVDRAGAVLRRVAHGSLEPYGLGPEAWGPFTARRPPVIDVGFLARLKAGQIVVRPDVAQVTPSGVEFINGKLEHYDVVLCATGFTTGLPELFDEPGLLDSRGRPAKRSRQPPGLYFAGYGETPRGQLFESARAAPRLAEAIDRHLGAKS